MIINIYSENRKLYFVRCLDTDRKMFIGSLDQCKQFQIKHNKGEGFWDGTF